MVAKLTASQITALRALAGAPDPRAFYDVNATTLRASTCEALITRGLAEGSRGWSAVGRYRPRLFGARITAAGRAALRAHGARAALTRRAFDAAARVALAIRRDRVASAEGERAMRIGGRAA